MIRNQSDCNLGNGNELGTTKETKGITIEIFFLNMKVRRKRSSSPVDNVFRATFHNVLKIRDVIEPEKGKVQGLKIEP